MNQNVVVQDRVAENQILVSAFQQPVNPAKEPNSTKNGDSPIHVGDISHHRHVLWEDIKQKDNDTPKQRNNINGVTPPTEIKVWSRREVLPASENNTKDWHAVRDLEGYSAARDDGVEGQITAENQKSHEKVDDDDPNHRSKRHREALTDMGEVVREGKGPVSCHRPS